MRNLVSLDVMLFLGSHSFLIIDYIYRENITKDLYVDLDELLQLRRFEFYP